MFDTNPKPIEGEIVDPKSQTTPNETIGREIAEAGKRGGVFIGTLNIMTEPARNFITDPLLGVYRSRYEGKFKRPKHVFAFDTGLVLLGAALAAAAIYFGLIYKPFEPINLTLAIAPDRPASGGQLIINLTAQNLSEDPIDSANVVLTLPEEISVFHSSLPYNKETGVIRFGSIESGFDANNRLTATLSGALGSSHKITAKMTFTERRTGKTGSRGASATVKIAASAIGAEFELPDNIVIGQEISGRIRYWNHGNKPVENVTVTPLWPDNFIVTSSDPKISNDRWLVGKLAPGSEGVIGFKGTLAAAGADAKFGVETGIKSGADNLLQSQSEKTLGYIDPLIAVTLSGPGAARLGDELTLTAGYKNSGEHSLVNATAKAAVDDGLEVISVDELSSADLKPGDEGKLTVKIRVKDALPESLANVVGPQMNVRLTIIGKLDGNDEVAISSPAWVVKIASMAGVFGYARYWSDDGEQLGRGPLPPAVGKATRYWIFWNVKNTINALNSVRVIGQLPDNVSFTGKTSAPFGGAVEFDPTTRIITWPISDVPAFPGVTSPAVGAAFEVSIIPTPDQTGTYPALLINQKISGIDSATGLAVSGAATDVNTRLKNDPKAVGTGPVTK